MKKLLVKKSDGTVALIIPSNEATPELLERDARNTENYVSHVEIDDADLPTNRRWRNAWVYSQDKIDIDLPKAKALHMNRLRIYRNKELQALDAQARIHAGNPIKLNEVNAKAQALRDMPVNFILSNRLNSLHTEVPAELEAYREEIEKDMSAPL